MKIKLFLLASIFVSLLYLSFSAGTFAAKPSENPSNVFSLPETARRVAPNVYYLGAVEYNGRLAEGYAFVDKGKRNAKPGTECGNGICEPGENAKKCPADCSGDNPDDPTDTSSCYGFLANGAKWKSVEPWVVNTSNTRGLNSNKVFSSLESSINEWENAAGTANIFGNGATTSATLEADTVTMDDKNEVYFADINGGAIGVTIVWGYFRGNPAWRELLEWDQVYNQVDYDWSENCLNEDCSEKMDFPNIAIHELGHSVGLDDLYNDKCSGMTMFGYGTFDETKKRSLEDGDINGASLLYQ